MNLPPGLRDELLSGYLDGELTADERARVEQILQRDEEARRLLDQLRQLGRELRAVSVEGHLDSGFSDRVWEATLAEAERQGLAADHPVRLAENQQQTPAAGVRLPLPSSSAALWGGVLAALAASILLVATLWSPEDREPLDPRVAEADPTAPVQDDEAPSPAPLVASNDPVDAQAPDAASLSGGEAELSGTAPADVPRDPDERIAAVAPAPSDAAAEAETMAEPSLAPDPEATPPQPRLVLVVDLVLSEQGLEQKVLENELERIGLGRPSSVPVDSAVLTGLRSQQLVAADTEAEDAAAGVQIFVLEGSAKRLDRLMVRLAQPELHSLVPAAKLAMTMLQDVSWLGTLAPAQPVDASAVRHAESRERAIQLVFEDNDPATSDEWFGRGADLPGIDLRSMAPGGQLPSAISQADEGPDFVTQVLVRVQVQP